MGLINIPCPSCGILYCYAKTLNIWCFETVISMHNTILPLYLEEAAIDYVLDGRFQSVCFFINIKQVNKQFKNHLILSQVWCVFFKEVQGNKNVTWKTESLTEWRFWGLSTLAPYLGCLGFKFMSAGIEMFVVCLRNCRQILEQYVKLRHKYTYFLLPHPFEISLLPNITPSDPLNKLGYKNSIRNI
jgi:hypothetical protein